MISRLMARGRHRLPLNPYRWPARVFLLIGIVTCTALGVGAALNPGEFAWNLGEVVADNNPKGDTPRD